MQKKYIKCLFKKLLSFRIWSIQNKGKKALNLTPNSKKQIHFNIICLFIIALMIPRSVFAQVSDEHSVNEMKKKYKTGQFEDVISLAETGLNNGFATKKLEEETYWILAKTYLELEMDDKAYEISRKLVQLNQYFEPASGDPQKFKDIITQIKFEGLKATVSSVSKKVEKIEEAPATVMVITEEDIKMRGYTDIEQIFSDLPGFDISRSWGITYSNLYQRGYRADNTERTLFMVDGVEESDLWGNVAFISTQYSVSNIKQIEIVYGPASTMYGANALVGVVNIITKEAEDIAVKDIVLNKKQSSFINKNKKVGSVGVKVDAGAGTYNTRYADVTLGAKKGKVSLITTFRKYKSDVIDLSDYKEFDYSLSDFDEIDYKSHLSIVGDGVQPFIDKYGIENINQLYDLKKDSEDNPMLELNETGENTAREYDKNLFREPLNGHDIEYSNLEDKTLFYGKLKIENVSIGYQSWSYKQGSNTGYGDMRYAPAKNGSVWVQKHSFFYVKFEKEISNKLSLINFAQYRITKSDDDTKSIQIFNYANKRLQAKDLISEKEPYWYSYHLYQIGRQFRNEFKLIYRPVTKFDIVGGCEIKNSIIQGDYRQTRTDTASVIEVGESGGDSYPGGNDFNIKDYSAYLQATYDFGKYFKLTLGGRYDYNRIRVTGGYESQFNQRIALVSTPGKFIFKLIHATAFQNASNFKKYSTATYRQLTNPTLEPEKVINYEFCAAYRFSDALFVDLALYNSRYDGVVGTAIVPYGDGTTQQNQAIGELKINGAQSTIVYKTKRISAFANYSYTHPLNNKIEDGKLTGDMQRIGDIAEHKFNVGINTYLLKGLNIGARMNYSGDRPVGENTTVPANPGDFPSHAVYHATLSYNWKYFFFQLICNNLLNEKYYDPGLRAADGSSYAYRTPQKERTFRLRVIFNLK